MKIPNAPAESDAILPWAEDITAAIRAIWPQNSGDILPRISLNGTTYALKKPRAAAPSSPPLDSFVGVGVSIPDPEDGPPTIYLLVVKGTVNDWTEDDGMTVTDAAEDGPAGSWKFELEPDTEKYFVEKVTLNSAGERTAVNLSLQTTASVTGPGDSETGEPPEFAYRKLFKVEVDEDYQIFVTQYTKGAQQCLVYVSDWSCESMTKQVAWLP